jgi:hypothetical protein
MHDKIVESLKTVIEAISPDRFNIIGVKETSDGLRFYVEPKTIDSSFLETDALVYEIIWHVENSTKTMLH